MKAADEDEEAATFLKEWSIADAAKNVTFAKLREKGANLRRDGTG